MITSIVALMMRLLGRRTCEDVAGLLQEYYEGTLDPELAATVERHFEDCPDCDAFARTYHEVMKLTGELSVDEIPEEVCVRARLALRERFGSRGGPR